MAYMATYNWVWLLGSAFIGFAMGWIAVVQRGDGLSTELMKKLAVLVAALVLLSLTRLIPDRAGYGLDLALVMFGVYLVGCAIGSGLRSWVVSRGSAAA